MSSFSHVIDLDADPSSIVSVTDSVVSKWQFVRHRRIGSFAWDPQKVRLHYCSGQNSSNMISGFDLWKELVYEHVLNANVLDYLFENQVLISEEWKRYYEVYFWGTMYQDDRSPPSLGVRCLVWHHDKWESWIRRLQYRRWRVHMPAAILDF